MPLLELIYSALGGWRGVALASLLILSLGWGGWNYVAKKHLSKRVDELAAEQSVNRGLIEHQNNEIALWKEAAEKQTALVSDAQKAQLEMARAYRQTLVEVTTRLQFTGDCKADVGIAAKEFARQARSK